MMGSGVQLIGATPGVVTDDAVILKRYLNQLLCLLQIVELYIKCMVFVLEYR